MHSRAAFGVSARGVATADGAASEPARRGYQVAAAVLAGDPSVDPTAPEVDTVVDEALRRGSRDGVLHAAGLWLDFQSDQDLRLSRSHSRGWVLGLQELIDSGHLDAAEYALPRLVEVFPHVPYLDYMTFVYAHLPPIPDNGRDRFLDDREADVQLVRVPGAETVVVAFCGAGHQLGISLNLADRWFGSLNAHTLYLKDRQQIGYIGGIASLGPDLDSTVRGLRQVLDETGAGRVVSLGNSAGASGALRYAPAIGSERVLALAPITGGRRYARIAATHLPPGAVMPWGDLVPLYTDDLGVRARIMYGEHNAGDRQQCMRMAGLPHVTVEALAGWESHHLIGGLIRAQRLDEVLDWLVGVGD